MPITRRDLSLGAAAALLSGCVSPPNDAAGPSRSTSPALRAAANPGFDAWVTGFRARAAGRGISQATLSAAFRGVGFLPGVIERDRNQTENVRSLEDYLNIATSDERLSQGRVALRRYGSVLQQIEARYGVAPHVVAAIWGLESRFGQRRGDIPVISALSTLAYDGRRGAFFESQLLAALRILQRGDITPAKMTGSWAGAMGHTQFIPTSFEAYAVDFNGDGRRDIWEDDPTDALASAAAYLSRSGWQTGRLWGVEAALPDGFNKGLAGRGAKRSVSAWRDLGLRQANGSALPDHGAASLILPGGNTGPAFIIF